MSERDPSAWLGSIREVLDALELRWAVMGAIAALVYRSTPRMTTDLDVLTEWSADLPSALEAAGYVVDVVADPGEDPHLVLARRSAERVDLLLPTVAYQHTALDRSIGGVLTVEDVLIHKLLAWRPRDQDDVASILAAGHDLDEAYIEHWVREWEIAQRWHAARGGRSPAG